MVFVPLFVLFLGTARTQLPYHIDAATNVFAAWTIGTTGSPILEDHAELADPSYRAVFAWVVPSPRGPVSQYPPGTALLAAPLYAAWWSDAPELTLVSENADASTTVRAPIPSFVPAAIIAAATTAAAMGLVALLGRTWASRPVAGLVGLVGGTATSAWSVAGDALWQHGPAMLWVSLGVYLASQDRWLGSGLAFGALVLTRPPVVLVGVALGVMLLIRQRPAPAGRMLVGAMPGVIALLAYNRWLFGTSSVAGGYGSVFSDRLIASDFNAYLSNISDALIDPAFGLFVWSPFVALLLVGVVGASRSAPDWVTASAVGGVLYLLLQLKLNRASGGAGFSYYRYPLEALVASAPILHLAWVRLWRMNTTARIGLLLTTGFSVVVHAMAAV